MPRVANASEATCIVYPASAITGVHHGKTGCSAGCNIVRTCGVVMSCHWRCKYLQ